jgi:hypothetical protein
MLTIQSRLGQPEFVAAVISAFSDGATTAQNLAHAAQELRRHSAEPFGAPALVPLLLADRGMVATVAIDRMVNADWPVDRVEWMILAAGAEANDGLFAEIERSVTQYFGLNRFLLTSDTFQLFLAILDASKATHDRGVANHLRQILEHPAEPLELIPFNPADFERRERTPSAKLGWYWRTQLAEKLSRNGLPTSVATYIQTLKKDADTKQETSILHEKDAVALDQ